MREAGEEHLMDQAVEERLQQAYDLLSADAEEVDVESYFAIQAEVVLGE